MKQTRIGVTLALALLVASAASIGAQGVETGPRWTGWIGCWSVAPADMQAIDRPGGVRLVCVTPTASTNVAHVSLRADGREFFRDTIDATGTPRAVERNGCAGSERASWSADGRRVYLKSSVVCGDAATDVTAILSLTPAGEWLDVRSIQTRGGTEVQVMRYRDIGTPSVVPSEVATLVTERTAAIKDARNAAAAKLEAKDVAEAWRVVGNAALVEVWMLENGLQVGTDSRTLQELADAGVPAQITDAMVSLARAEKDGSGKRYTYAYLPFDERMRCYGCERNRDWDQGTGQRVIFQAWQYEDPWNYSIFRGFLGSYGQFGYPNHVRGYDATYGILGSGAARSSVPDLRPPVITLTNNVNPTEVKAPPARDDGAARQVSDAIASAVEGKAKGASTASSPIAPKSSSPRSSSPKSPRR